MRVYPIVGLFVAVGLVGVHHAHAGWATFVRDLMARSLSAGETAREHTLSSQNIALLQSVAYPDSLHSRGGGDITIVEGTALVSETGPLGTIADLREGVPPAGSISLYVVREGDTLSQIAQMFDVAQNTIRWANDMPHNDVIRVGQTLVILPVNGVRYTVKKGDTLASITASFKGDLNEIAQFNGIAGDSTLAIGTEIIIPDGVMVVTPKASIGKAKSGAPEYKGYYMHPLSGGQRTQGLHGYNGVDIGAPSGSSIVAAASGKVLIARSGGWNGGYGSYAVIAHGNGTQTLYAHMSRVALSEGQQVAKGELVGYVGNTGRSTGPHLHFEVRGAKNPF